MDTIRHAIVGCGRVAPNHVDGFGSISGVELRWACDRDPEIPDRFARRYGIERCTTDVTTVLTDPEVDSVSITVDHAQHVPLATAALRHGKHVLLEKPIGTTVADAQQLADLARAQSLVLAVVSQHRYDPLVGSVRRWLAEGLLGRPLLCTVSLHGHRPSAYYTDSYWRGTWRGEGGSALINQGYHCLDVAQWLCGPFTVRGSAAARTVLADSIETEETLCAVLTGPGGLLGTLAVTVASSETWRSRLELVGESGTVVFDLDHPNRLHHWSGNPELRRRAAEAAAQAAPETAPGIDYYGISHRQQIADFCRSIRTGEPMLSPVSDAVHTLRLIRELYQAAEVGPAPSGQPEAAAAAVPPRRVRAEAS